MTCDSWRKRVSSSGPRSGMASSICTSMTVDGNLIRRLTEGPWPVGRLRGVDEERGLVYWEGWTESPLEQHLYRACLAADERTGQPEQVSQRAGWHETTLARDCAHWIDAFSDSRCPTRVYLRTIEGGCLATLEGNDLPERDEYEWAESEFVVIPAADGTPLHGRVTRPLGMEPDRTSRRSSQGTMAGLTPRRWTVSGTAP